MRIRTRVYACARARFALRGSSQFVRYLYTLIARVANNCDSADGTRASDEGGAPLL